MAHLTQLFLLVVLLVLENCFLFIHKLHLAHFVGQILAPIDGLFFILPSALSTGHLLSAFSLFVPYQVLLTAILFFLTSASLLFHWRIVILVVVVFWVLQERRFVGECLHQSEDDTGESVLFGNDLVYFAGYIEQNFPQDFVQRKPRSDQFHGRLKEVIISRPYFRRKNKISPFQTIKQARQQCPPNDQLQLSRIQYLCIINSRKIDNLMQAGRETTKMRVKTSPAQNQCPKHSHKLTPLNILPFPSQLYPFLNTTTSPISALKTTINLTITPPVLQKIVATSHPNMIAITKILKTTPKDQAELSSATHYSFFYEPIHYSLKYLAQHPSEDPRLHNLLISANVPFIVSSLAHYLEQSAIYYAIKPSDLGISLEGDIKVYIPPQAIFSPDSPSALQNSAVQMAHWWEAELQEVASWGFKKEKKALQLQPPKLSFNEDFSLDDQSARDSILEKQLDDLLEDGDEVGETPGKDKLGGQLKESVSSLSKVGSLQLQKINRINEEIKVIREKMKEKKRTDPELLKKDFSRTKVVDKVSPQLMKPPPETAPAKQNKREAIQQNINCINIYNHNTPLPNNYNFHPNHYKGYPPPDPYHYYDDNYSQDTYDIEFEGQFETPPDPHNTNPFRHTIFTADRDLSEYQGGQKPRDHKYKELKAKQHVNQVCNKNYTESAGPLQFKSLVSKFIKTQEKNEEEQKGSSGDGFQSQKRRSVSVEKGFRQKQFKELCPLSPKVQSSCEIKTKTNDIRRNYSQNMFSVSTRLNGNCEGPKPIQEKVRMALEKTKNAIALLNKVKHTKHEKFPPSQ